MHDVTALLARVRERANAAECPELGETVEVAALDLLQVCEAFDERTAENDRLRAEEAVIEELVAPLSVRDAKLSAERLTAIRRRVRIAGSARRHEFGMLLRAVSRQRQRIREMAAQIAKLRPDAERWCALRDNAWVVQLEDSMDDDSLVTVLAWDVDGTLQPVATGDGYDEAMDAAIACEQSEHHDD